MNLQAIIGYVLGIFAEWVIPQRIGPYSLYYLNPVRLFPRFHRLTQLASV